MDAEILSYNNILNEHYINQGEAVSVNFREKLPYLNGVDRYSHTIHPYPAKLIPHIPYFFLNNEEYIRPGEIVLDPFCGSGTTLLEANLLGINAWGVDANPLARLISKCKTTPICSNRALEYLHWIINHCSDTLNVEIPSFKNINLWFSKRVQNDLARLYSTILLVEEEKYKDFFMMCLSVTLKKSSYTDPRISVPVRVNAEKYAKGSVGEKKAKEIIKRVDIINVFETFEMVCRTNIKRISTLDSVKNLGKTIIISKDARRITENLISPNYLKDESVDMILTSPPYASAQKYIRSSSLSLYWLRLLEGNSIIDLDSQNIGRENYHKALIKKQKVGIKEADDIIDCIFERNPMRGTIVCHYLLEMEEALDECFRILKPNKYFVIIVGNNNVCGYPFNTKDYLSDYLIKKGMELRLELIDDIKSYGLMTKRNKTADIITREWILVFKKK